MFVTKEKEEVRSADFNFFYYIASIILGVLDFCGCKPKWDKTRTFMECSEEMINQLDVTYILQKLMFLESAVSKMIEPHELSAIQLRQKMSVG